MTETQNDPTEKQLYYFNKPIGEERGIRYTKENSLYENQYRVYTWLRRIGKCVVCGDSFRGNRNSYCSQRCINDAAMLAVKVARLKKRTNAKTVCPSCGQAFTIAKSGRIRKFCSNKCRQRAHRVLRNAVKADLPQTALCNGLQVAHSRPKNTGRAKSPSAEVALHVNTARALAKAYGVSERTIRRDGKRAEAIDKLALTAPEQAQAVIDGKKRFNEVLREKILL